MIEFYQSNYKLYLSLFLILYSSVYFLITHVAATLVIVIIVLKHVKYTHIGTKLILNLS